MRSLMTKLVLLTAAAGLVVWIGWPMPATEEEPPTSAPHEAHSPSGPMLVDNGLAEATPRTGTAPIRRHTGARVDLNRASPGELESLPGIGSGLAKRIVDHRRQHGNFRSVEDLARVKGIGMKRLERLRSLVMVGKAPVAEHGQGGEGQQRSGPGG